MSESNNNEFNDLKGRAKSLQGTPDRLIARRNRILLLSQIANYEGKSPESIKRFLDLNADNILELHQAYERAGRNDLAHKFQEMIQKMLVNPAYISLNDNAGHSSSTSQLVENLSLKSNVLSKASVADPTEGMARAPNVRADTQGLIEPSLKHEQVVENKTQTTFIGTIKNKLKL